MAVGLSTRLVLVTGTCIGIGKTTLAAGLVSALEHAGIDGELVSEHVIFERQDFFGLAEAFRRRQFPGPEDLLAGWSRLVASFPPERCVVHDGSWMPLAEDLPWAQESWGAIVGYTRRLLEIAAELDPMVLFLEGSAETALARAAAGRGPGPVEGWLDYLRRLPTLAAFRDGSPEELVQAILAARAKE